MFTTNQLIFAVCFFIGFVIVIAISYRKDKALHRKYYKGTKWVLLGFILFIALLLLLKIAMKS